MELNGSVNLESLRSTGVDLGKVVEETVREIEQILSGENVHVTNAAKGISLRKPGKGAPVLDEDRAGETWKEDLARLISYLILEDSETQMKETGRRMQLMTDKMIANQKDLECKIGDAVKEAAEQSKQERKRKILGYILTAVSVVAAVTSAVVTFGAAAPGAFMLVSTVASLVGAAASLTTTLMDAFGGTDAILKSLAKSYQEDDKSLSDGDALRKASDNWSTGWMIANAIVSVVAIGSSIANLVKGVGAGAQCASRALKWFQTGLTVAGQAGGGVQAYLSFRSAFNTRDAEFDKAALDELMKFLDSLRQKIEEDRLLLEDIIARLQGTVTAIVDVATAGEDNMQLMMKNMGQMI